MNEYCSKNHLKSKFFYATLILYHITWTLEENVKHLYNMTTGRECEAKRSIWSNLHNMMTEQECKAKQSIWNNLHNTMTEAKQSIQRPDTGKFQKIM